MKRIVALFLSLYLVISPLLGYAPDIAEAASIMSTESRVDTLAYNPTGNVVIDRASNPLTFGVSKRKFYRDFQMSSGSRTETPNFVLPWYRTVMLTPEERASDITLDRVHDEVNQFGFVTQKGKQYRLYKLVYFPEGGVRFPYDPEIHNVENHNFGFASTKDLKMIGFNAKVEEFQHYDEAGRRLSQPTQLMVRTYSANIIKGQTRLVGDVPYDGPNQGTPGLAYVRHYSNQSDIWNHLVSGRVNTPYVPAVRLAFATSKDNLSDPATAWFTGDAWNYDHVVNQGKNVPELDISDLHDAVVFQSGVNTAGSSTFFPRYTFYILCEVVDPEYDQSFSGITAGSSSWWKATLLNVSEIDGYKREDRFSDRVKVKYREHFNSIVPNKAVPTRELNFTKQQAPGVSVDYVTSAHVHLDKTTATAAKSYTETVLGFDQPLNDATSNPNISYDSILDFRPQEVDGYHLRTFTNGKSYKLSQATVNGVREVTVDVYYDDDIVDGTDTANRPTGDYVAVIFLPSTNYRDPAGHAFKPNETTRFFVKKSANKKLKDIPYPVLSDVDQRLFSQWRLVGASGVYGDPLTQEQPIDTSMIIGAEYQDIVDFDPGRPDYVKVTFQTDGHSTFQNESATSKSLWVLKTANKTLRDVVARAPKPVASDGYALLDPAWLDVDTNQAVNLSQSSEAVTAPKTFMVRTKALFNATSIKKIEIVDLKPDYWLREYFDPGSPMYPLVLKLTDASGLTKTVKYTDVIGGKKAFEYYGLSFFVPEGMAEKGMDIVGTGPNNKIAMPHNPEKNLSIGVQLDANPEVRVVSNPKGNYSTSSPIYSQRGRDAGIYTFFEGIETNKSFKVEAFRNQGGTWTPINYIPINRSYKIAVTYATIDDNKTANFIKVRLPGFDSGVLSWWDPNRTVSPRYVVLNRVPGTKRFEGMVTSEVPTRDITLQPVSGSWNKIRAYGKELPFEVYPELISRGSDPNAPYYGYQPEDYIRLVQQADEPTVLAQGQSKGYFGTENQKTYYRVYDQLKDLPFSTIPELLNRSNIPVETSFSGGITAIKSHTFTGWNPADLGTYPTSGVTYQTATYQQKPFEKNAVTNVEIVTLAKRTYTEGEVFNPTLAGDGTGTSDQNFVVRLTDSNGNTENVPYSKFADYQLTLNAPLATKPLTRENSTIAPNGDFTKDTVVRWTKQGDASTTVVNSTRNQADYKITVTKGAPTSDTPIAGYIKHVFKRGQTSAALTSNGKGTLVNAGNASVYGAEEGDVVVWVNPFDATTMSLATIAPSATFANHTHIAWQSPNPTQPTTLPELFALPLAVSGAPLVSTTADRVYTALYADDVIFVDPNGGGTGRPTPKPNEDLYVTVLYSVPAEKAKLTNPDGSQEIGTANASGSLQYVRYYVSKSAHKTYANIESLFGVTEKTGYKKATPFWISQAAYTTYDANAVISKNSNILGSFDERPSVSTEALPGYTKVIFKQGAHGSLAPRVKDGVTYGASENDTVVLYVNPEKDVALAEYAPVVTPTVGYTHSAWTNADKLTPAQKYTVQTEFEAQYTKNADFSTEPIAGYWRVVFKKGDASSLAAKDSNSVVVTTEKLNAWKQSNPSAVSGLAVGDVVAWVNPVADAPNLSSLEPTVVAGTGKSLVGWMQDKNLLKTPLSGAITANVELSAKVNDSVIPDPDGNKENPNPAVYASVVFSVADAQGTLKYSGRTLSAQSGTASMRVYVDKTAHKTLGEVAALVEVEARRGFSKKDPLWVAENGSLAFAAQTEITQDLAYRADFNALPDVSPDPLEGYQKVVFNKGDGQNLSARSDNAGKKLGKETDGNVVYYVNPDKQVALSSLAPDHKPQEGYVANLDAPWTTSGSVPFASDTTVTKKTDTDYVYTAQYLPVVYTVTDPDAPIPTHFIRITLNSSDKGRFFGSENASDTQYIFDVHRDTTWDNNEIQSRVARAGNALQSNEPQKYTFKEWSPQIPTTGTLKDTDALNGGNALTFTAQFTPNISFTPIDGYFKIVFDPGEHAEISSLIIPEMLVKDGPDKGKAIVYIHPHAEPILYSSIWVAFDIKDADKGQWANHPRLPLLDDKNQLMTESYITGSKTIRFNAIKTLFVAGNHDASPQVPAEQDKDLYHVITFNAGRDDTKLILDGHDPSNTSLQVYMLKETTPWGGGYKPTWALLQDKVPSVVIPDEAKKTHYGWLDAQNARQSLPFASATEIKGNATYTANYVDLVSTEPVDGYVHVSFDKGTYGKLTAKGTQSFKQNTNGTWEVWVAPDRGVKLSAITPEGALDPQIVGAQEYMVDSAAPWGASYDQDHAIGTADKQSGLSYTLQFKKIVQDATDGEVPAGYVRIELNAGEGHFGSDESAKTKRYDVLKDATWKQFTDLIQGVPNPVAPNDKPNFLGWDPTLPADDTQIATLVSGSETSKTYTATYGADVVKAKDPSKDDDNPSKDLYVSVRFDGIHDQAKVREGESEATTSLKYYVVKNKAQVTFTPQVNPVYEVGFEQDGTYPWTKDGQNAAFVAGPREFKADETYTVSVKASPDVSNVDRPGYTKITFTPGTHGSLVPQHNGEANQIGTAENGNVAVWINPKKDIKIQELLPVVSAHVGYTHNGWSNSDEFAVAKKYTDPVTTEAQYDQNTNFSTEPQAGYWRVLFKKGSAESLANKNGNTVVVTDDKIATWRSLDASYVTGMSAGDVVTWVNPVASDSNLKDLEPTVTAGTGKTLVGWTNVSELLTTPLDKVIRESMDLTASIADSVIVDKDGTTPNPNPQVYVKVTLSVDTQKGTLSHDRHEEADGTISFYVDKNAGKTYNDIVGLVEVGAKLGFEKANPLWKTDAGAEFDLGTQVGTDTNLVAQFNTLPDVSDTPQPGYVEVHFYKGDGENLTARTKDSNKLGNDTDGNVVYYVNPSKNVALSTLVPDHAPKSGFVANPVEPWKTESGSEPYATSTTVADKKTYAYTAQYFAKVKDAEGETVPAGFTRIVLNAGDGTFNSGDTKTHAIDVYSDVEWTDSTIQNKISAHQTALVAPSDKPVFISWSPKIPASGKVSETTGVTDNKVSFTATFAPHVSTTEVEGYTKVEFTPGDHGVLTEKVNGTKTSTGTVVVWVNPAGNVTFDAITPTVAVKDEDKDTWAVHPEKPWGDTYDKNAVVGNDPVSFSPSFVKIVDSNPDENNKYLYFEITFKAGDHGSFASSATEKKVYVLKASAPTWSRIKTEVPAVNVEASVPYTHYGWTKDADTTNVLQLPLADNTKIEANEVYTAHYIDLVITEPVAGYVHVTFNKGAYGKLTAKQGQNLKATADGGLEAWVAPNKGVTLERITPDGALDTSIKNATQYMVNPDTPWDNSYDAAHELVQTDVANGLAYSLQFKKIVEDATDGEVPAGYVRITLDAGEGHFNKGDQDKTRSYDVLKQATWKQFIDLIGGVPALTAPTAKPNFLGWNPVLPADGVTLGSLVSGDETSKTYTATYGADVVKAKDPDKDDDNPSKDLYVAVRFNGVENQAKVQEAGSEAVSALKYYVIKDKQTTFGYTVAPVFEVGFEQNGDNAWTKDGAPADFQKGPRNFTNDETYTVSVKASPDVSETERPGYTKVSFAPGTHGALTPKTNPAGGTYGKVDQGNVVMWVNPTKDITLSDFAPSVQAHVGYSYAGWNDADKINTSAKHTSPVSVEATYSQNDNFSTTPVEGYWRVVFKKGDAQSLTAREHTVLVTDDLLREWQALKPEYAADLTAGDVVTWVNPVATAPNLSSLEPGVDAGANKSLVGWNQGQELLKTPLNKVIDKSLELSAKTMDSVIAKTDDNTPNPNPQVYAELTFKVEDAKGVLKLDGAVVPASAQTATKTFFVDKAKSIKVADVAGKLTVEPRLGFANAQPLWVAEGDAEAFSDSIVVTKNAVYHADFTTLDDVSPVEHPGYVAVTFNKGEGNDLVSREVNGKKLGVDTDGNVIYYVNPSKGVALSTIVPEHAPKTDFVVNPSEPWKASAGSEVYVGTTKVVENKTYTYTAQYFAKVKDAEGETVPAGFTRVVLNAGEGAFGATTSDKVRAIDVYNDVEWNNAELTAKIAAHQTTLVAPTNKPVFVTWSPKVPTSGKVAETNTVADGKVSFTATFAPAISTEEVEGYTRVEFVPGDHGALTEKVPGSKTQDGKVVVWVDPKSQITFDAITPSVEVKDSDKDTWAVHPEKPWGDAYRKDDVVDTTPKTFSPIFVKLVDDAPADENKQLYHEIVFKAGAHGTFASETDPATKKVYVLKAATALGDYKPTWQLLESKVPSVVVPADTPKTHYGWINDADQKVYQLPLSATTEITSDLTYTANYIDLVVTEPVAGYVHVTFNKGAYGKLTAKQDQSLKATDNGGFEAWVAPDKGVKLSAITPEGAIDPDAVDSNKYMVNPDTPWNNNYNADHVLTQADVQADLGYTLQFKQTVVENPTDPNPAEGYIRVVLNAGEGHFGTTATDKTRSYDVLKQATWKQFSDLIGGVPNPVAPADKPNFLDWSPVLPEEGTTIADIVSGSDVSKTYTATYAADVVVARDPNSDADKPHADKYVSVRFEGVEGQAKVQQNSDTAVSALKYYVIKGKETTFNYTVAPVFEVGFEQNGDNAWTKDGQNTAFVAGPREFVADETYTVSVKASPDVSSTSRPGYTTITFKPGVHGSIAPKTVDGQLIGTAENNNVMLYVNPNKDVKLADYLPVVSAHVGYTHSGWTQDSELNVAKKHTQATESEATYSQNDAFSAEPQAGYWRVVFKKGDAQSLTAKNNSEVVVTEEKLEAWKQLNPAYVTDLTAGDVVTWVNPVATAPNLSSLEPSVVAGTDKTLVGWRDASGLKLTPLSGVISSDMTLIAELQNSIVANPDGNTPNPNENVYVKVTLTVDPVKGTLTYNGSEEADGTVSFYVDKNAGKTYTDIVGLVGVDAKLGFEKTDPLWKTTEGADADLTTSIGTETALVAGFNTLPNVSDKPHPGYVAVTFNKGEGNDLASRESNGVKLGKVEDGNVIYYVNPSKNVALSSLVPTHAPRVGYVVNPVEPWKKENGSETYSDTTTVSDNKTYTYTAQYFAKVKDAEGDTVPAGFTRVVLNAGEGAFSNKADDKVRAIDVYDDVEWNNAELTAKIAAHQTTLVAPTNKPVFVTWTPKVPTSGKVKDTENITDSKVSFTATFAPRISTTPVEGYTKIEFVPGDHGVLTEKVPGSKTQDGTVVVYVDPKSNISYNDVVPTITVKDSDKDAWALHPEKPWGDTFNGEEKIGETPKSFTPVFVAKVTENPADKDKQLYHEITFKAGAHGTFASETDPATKKVYVLKAATALGDYKPTWQLLAGKVPAVTVNGSYTHTGWKLEQATDTDPVVALPRKEGNLFSVITSAETWVAQYDAKPISNDKSTITITKNPDSDPSEVKGPVEANTPLRIEIVLKDPEGNTPAPSRLPDSIQVQVPGVDGVVTLTPDPETPGRYVTTVTPSHGGQGSVAPVPGQDNVPTISKDLVVTEPSRAATTIEQVYAPKAGIDSTNGYDPLNPAHNEQKVVVKVPLKTNESALPDATTVVVQVGENADPNKRTLTAVPGKIVEENGVRYVVCEAKIPETWTEEERKLLTDKPVSVIVDEDGKGAVFVPTTTDTSQGSQVLLDLQAPVLSDVKLNHDRDRGFFSWSAVVTGEKNKDDYVVGGRYDIAGSAVQGRFDVSVGALIPLSDPAAAAAAERDGRLKSYKAQSVNVEYYKIPSKDAVIILMDRFGNAARIPLVVKTEIEKAKFKVFTPVAHTDTIKVSSQETTGTYTVTITYNGQKQSQQFELTTGTQKLLLADLLKALSVSDLELLSGMKVEVKLAVPNKQDVVLESKVR